MDLTLVPRHLPAPAHLWDGLRDVDMTFPPGNCLWVYTTRVILQLVGGWTPLENKSANQPCQMFGQSMKPPSSVTYVLQYQPKTWATERSTEYSVLFCDRQILTCLCQWSIVVAFGKLIWQWKRTIVSRWILDQFGSTYEEFFVFVLMAQNQASPAWHLDDSLSLAHSNFLKQKYQSSTTKPKSAQH